MISKRAELHIDLRHDFILVLGEAVQKKHVQALKQDLEKLNFNVINDFDTETSEWRMLIGLND